MLPAVTLHREYRLYCTFGKMTLPDGEVLDTLERPWLNNMRNKSCIPPGVYKCTWLPRSASGRYKRVWIVEGVPERSGILFHTGNLVRHSKGCILPGRSRGRLKGRDAVLSSGPALNRMRRQLVGKDFELTIV